MARPFRFNVVTAVQAVGFLLRRECAHRMNYMRLLKILYISEREIIRDSGKPLTGSKVIAMKRGPVLEDVYSLIRSQHIDTPFWAEHFQVVNYDLKMLRDPGVGKLPRFITDKLNEVADRHVLDDEMAMVELTHTLPEWIKNDPGDSSKEISLRDILDAVGRAADFDRIVGDAKNDAFTDDFFRDRPNEYPPSLSW